MHIVWKFDPAILENESVSTQWEIPGSHRILDTFHVSRTIPTSYNKKKKKNVISNLQNKRSDSRVVCPNSDTLP